jgi:hypothetical protein
MKSNSFLFAFYYTRRFIVDTQVWCMTLHQEHSRGNSPVVETAHRPLERQ